MINFYHRYLPGIAAVLAPLHALVTSATTAKSTLAWSADQTFAFCASKKRLQLAKLLHHPDPYAELTLTTDASDVAMGAVLVQHGSQPLGFFSKKLTTTQTKYSAFDKELLAVKEAVAHFRHMIEGKTLVVYTDHKPLTMVMSSTATRTPRQERHLSFISEFTTDLRHVRGEENVVADWLSRPTDSPDAGVVRVPSVVNPLSSTCLLYTSPSPRD